MPAPPPRPPVHLPLHRGWSVRATSLPDDVLDPGAIPATVPGCIHTDLLAAGVIPDPFLDTNELEVAWVAEGDWQYRASIDLDEDVIGRDRAQLVFAGLDTLARVELNGHVVGTTANMHRSYRFDVGGIARAGANELVVTFASATRAAEAWRELEGRWPSASFGRPFNYLRKMACSWGWDWGPWLTTAGVWRPVELHAWDGARLAAVRPSTAIDATDVGVVDVVVQLERAVTADLTVSAQLFGPDGMLEAMAVAPAPGAADRVDLQLYAGPVQRWWPRDQGGQPLYPLQVVLTDELGTMLDSWERPVGFRTVELDTRSDATGAAFTLVVNGRPMFARGVNWIPDDPFPSRVDRQRYRARLEAVAATNVDLVRVWGGGIYEDDAFYDACDELGLLVWQDFCFACAAYPEHLLAEEVEAEARHNVERLMPHPSLALWNGSNENIWGFVDWRWQDELQGRPWGGGFYFDLLPRIVAELDPHRPYWPGSPYAGTMAVAPNADAHGCTHVWDVWNALDYERYRDHTPRFVAEFGWQAPPAWPTLRAAVSDDPLTPSSPGLEHHQKAADGAKKLARGLTAHLGVPEDMDAWLWAAQLTQARAVRVGVEHFRSLRPVCMGTIWWQFNDCWPATSWAVLDAAGRRKPAWYALRDAYAPQLLTIQPRGAGLVVVAVNELDEPWRVIGRARRVSFDGGEVAGVPLDLEVPPRSSRYVVLPPAVSSPDDPAAEAVVVGAGSAKAWWWFRPDRELTYPAAELDLDVLPVGPAEHRLTVSARTLVRDLAFLVDRLEPDAWVDRQLLTLLPGDIATLTVTGVLGLDAGRLAGSPVCWSANHLIVGRAAGD